MESVEKTVAIVGPLFGDVPPHQFFGGVKTRPYESVKGFLADSEHFNNIGLVVVKAQDVDAICPLVRSRSLPLLVLMDSASGSGLQGQLTQLDISADFFWPDSTSEEVCFRVHRLLNNRPFRELCLDPIRYVLRREERASEVLTLKEFQILQALLGAPSFCMRRERLIELIWGERRTSPKVLDVHFSNLRKKLKVVSLTISASLTSDNPKEWIYELTDSKRCFSKES